MKHIAISLAVLMLMWGSDAKAKERFLTSGIDLFSDCTGNSEVRKIYCVGYIIGVIDASNSVCVTNVNRVQLRDIVIKYLTENPQERHFTARSLIEVSLVPVFPCKK